MQAADHRLGSKPCEVVNLRSSWSSGAGEPDTGQSWLVDVVRLQVGRTRHRIYPSHRRLSQRAREQWEEEELQRSQSTQRPTSRKRNPKSRLTSTAARRAVRRTSLKRPSLRRQAARAVAFRFLRHPKKPIAPRPVAKSGRAAGSGVVVSEFASTLIRSEPVLSG